MARPRIEKNGLVYFPLDCELDIKVEQLEVKFENNGFAVWVKTLQQIYQIENGELLMTELMFMLLAKRCFMTVEKYTSIINVCLEIDLFDKQIFDSDNILTSNGIKKRILEINKSRDKMRLWRSQKSNQQVTNESQTGNNEVTNLVQISNNSVTNELQTELQNSHKLVTTGLKEKREKRKDKDILLNISIEGENFANHFKNLLPETQKIGETDLRNWAKTFDELIRIDKRNEDEIYLVTNWARKDDFWKSNFLSANKLRNKNKDGVYYYDIFLEKAKRTNGVNGNGKLTGELPSWLFESERI